MKYEKRVTRMLDESWSVKLYPEKGSIKTTPRERSLAWALSAHANSDPKNHARADLLSDTFFALFKNEPELVDSPGVGRVVNRAVLAWAKEQYDFEETRKSTSSDVLASQIAASFTWEVLIQDETLKAALELQDKAEEKQQEADSDNDVASQYDQRGLPNSASEKRKSAEQPQKEADALSQKAESLVQKLSKSQLGKGVMATALKAGKEKADEAKELLTTWGDEQGSMGDVDPNEVLKAMKTGSLLLDQIAEIAGRFKQAIMSTMDDVKRNYVGSAVDVTLTRQFDKMFSTERAKLSPSAHPIARMNAIVGYINAGLLGYTLKSDAKQGGSFVAEVDGSGSMRGESEVTAKAIAIGLAKALSQDPIEKRTYEIAMFGSNRDGILAITKDSAWNEKMSWASKLFGGGTDFSAAFKDGIARLYRLYKKNVRGCDLLFITDGQAHIGQTTVDAWMKCKEATGARLFYIQIGNDAYYNEEAKALSDLYVCVPDLSEETAKKILIDISTRIASQ